MLNEKKYNKFERINTEILRKIVLQKQDPKCESLYHFILFKTNAKGSEEKKIIIFLSNQLAPCVFALFLSLV